MKSNGEAIGTTGKKIIYEEKAPFSKTMRRIMISILSIIALSIIGVVFGYYYGLEKEPFEGQFGLILAVMIISFVVSGFFQMKFMITEKSVDAVMQPFSYRVMFSEIKNVSTTDIPWYLGWGLRIWNRRIAFVSMHKKAVRIEKENGFFRTFILTNRNPDEFVRMIKERMKGGN